MAAMAGDIDNLVAFLCQLTQHIGTNFVVENRPGASGTIGTITPRRLGLELIGSASKVYDGTTAIELAQSNIKLNGLITGETITVTTTAATLVSANVTSGARTTLTLASSDYAAGSGTLLANYLLPTSAKP